MKRIFCAVCISLLAWKACAGEIDDNLKKFEAAVQNAAEQTSKGGSLRARSPGAEMVPQRIRERIASNDLNGAIGLIYSEMQSWKTGACWLFTDEEKKSLSDLLSSLQKEQEKRDQAEIATIDSAIAHATAAVKKAKVAADLDANVDELAKAQIQQCQTQKSVAVNAKYREAKDIRDFVSEYQEYLAAKAGEYDEQAREIARKLADAPVRLFSRSELLAKAYEPKAGHVKQPIETEASNPPQAVLNIGPNGTVRLGKGAPMSLDEMKKAMELLKAANPNIAVIVHAPGNLPYQEITEVMEVLKQEGIWNVAFAAPAPTGQPIPAK